MSKKSWYILGIAVLLLGEMIFVLDILAEHVKNNLQIEAEHDAKYGRDH